MSAQKIGKIDISNLNTPPNKYELRTAKFFAERGKDIKFIRPSNRKGDHRADFWMDGANWEVKYPSGKSSRTIENNFRKAIKQSNHIIFDLRAMGNRKDNAVKRLTYEAKMRRQKIHMTIIIDKHHSIDIET